MNKTLYILCGPPGAGKSHYCETLCYNHSLNHDLEIISRDDIRFSLLRSNDTYFSFEKTVYDIFIKRINDAIKSDNILYIAADATHINKQSRLKLLNKLNLNNVDVIPIWFNTSEKDCQIRNELRTGRRRVPKEVIHQMFLNKTHPKDDNFNYKEIIEIG